MSRTVIRRQRAYNTWAVKTLSPATLGGSATPITKAVLTRTQARTHTPEFFTAYAHKERRRRPTDRRKNLLR